MTTNVPKELTLRRDLLEKPFIIALNKSDIEGSEEYFQKFRVAYNFPEETLFEISALTGAGLPELIHAMRTKAQANGKKYH